MCPAQNTVAGLLFQEGRIVKHNYSFYKEKEALSSLSQCAGEKTKVITISYLLKLLKGDVRIFLNNTDLVSICQKYNTKKCKNRS